MKELPEVTPEFRSWIQQGLASGSKWLVVMFDPDEVMEYPHWVDTDADLEALRKDEHERILNEVALDAGEDEIVLRVRLQWAADELQEQVKSFSIDLAVALATCPKRFLREAAKPHGAESARQAIVDHCVLRMRPWMGFPPAEAPTTH